MPQTERGHEKEKQLALGEEVREDKRGENKNATEGGTYF